MVRPPSAVSYGTLLVFSLATMAEASWSLRLLNTVTYVGRADMSTKIPSETTATRAITPTEIFWTRPMPPQIRWSWSRMAVNVLFNCNLLPAGAQPANRALRALGLASYRHPHDFLVGLYQSISHLDGKLAGDRRLLQRQGDVVNVDLVAGGQPLDHVVGLPLDLIEVGHRVLEVLAKRRGQGILRGRTSRLDRRVGCLDQAGNLGRDDGWRRVGAALLRLLHRRPAWHRRWGRCRVRSRDRAAGGSRDRRRAGSRRSRRLRPGGREGRDLRGRLCADGRFSGDRGRAGGWLDQCRGRGEGKPSHARAQHADAWH